MLDGYQAPQEKSMLAKGCMAIAILVVVVSFFMLGMAIYMLNKAFSGGTGSPDLETVANITRIDFPKSAKLSNSHLTLNLDRQTLYAKVEMDKLDVDGFVQKLAVARKSTEDKLGTTNRVWSANQSWWDPDSVQDFIAVKTKPSPKVAHLLISMDQSDSAVLYLRQD